jgi:hypothetical protein
MIHDYDRRFWFGASDAKYIFSPSVNNSWRDWWDVKIGKEESKFTGNIYTKAGNTYEHSILKAWNPNLTLDRQILIPNLRFRVNLDGNLDDTIVECKTYQINKKFEVTDGYYYQAQLQMLAWKLEPWMNFVPCDGCPTLKPKNKPLQKHIILAYGLYPDEYYAEYSKEQIENGEIPIDHKRILEFEIKPSRSVQRKGRKSLKKLAKKMRKEALW